MISWFGFVVVALAAYRATRVLTTDSLTLAWRDRLFTWAWRETDEHGALTDPQSRGPVRSYVYELLTCSWCLGVWVAAACFALWRWGGNASHGLLVVLAAAGVQGFLASRADA